MPGAHFNPPPNWPVSRGWPPQPDWEPDPSWPPAPAGWQFWIDDHAHVEDADEEPRAPRCYEPQERPGAPTLGRPGGRGAALLAGAAMLAIALTAGMVAAVNWWTRSPDGAPHAEHTLPGTYPTEPRSAWAVTAPSLVSGADADFASPLFGADAPGAIVVGDRVIVHAVPEAPSVDGARQVALSLADGGVEWSTLTNLTDGCARDLIADMLPCITLTAPGREDAVKFVDINTGTTVSTAQLPFRVSMVATDGRSVYTAGYEDATPKMLTVDKGSPDAPLADWKTTVPPGPCAGYGSGDAMDLRVDDGIVWGFLGLGAHIALRDADGSPIFDHAVTNVTVLKGTTVTARPCLRGVESAQWPTEVTDGEGRLLLTTTAPVHQHRFEAYTDGRGPLITIDGKALDLDTSETLWRSSKLAGTAANGSSWLIDNMMIVAGHGLTAYDVRTGDQLWQYPTPITGNAAVTDGLHLFISNNRNGIDAVTIADGSLAWKSGWGYGNKEPWELYATRHGILVVNRERVFLLRPTGPPAAKEALS